jgi:hypothetical protein
MSISEEQSAQFKEKYGEALAFHENAKHGLFIFRKPSKIIWKKFRTMSNKPNADVDACAEDLVSNCLCFPEAEGGKPDFAKLRLLFEDCPALVDEIVVEVHALAKGQAPTTGKL